MRCINALTKVINALTKVINIGINTTNQLKLINSFAFKIIDVIDNIIISPKKIKNLLFIAY